MSLKPKQSRIEVMTGVSERGGILIYATYFLSYCLIVFKVSEIPLNLLFNN